jgi:hypothetical protein
MLTRRLDDYMAPHDLEVELVTVLLIRNLCGSDWREKAATLNIRQMMLIEQSLVTQGTDPHTNLSVSTEVDASSLASEQAISLSVWINEAHTSES